MYNIFRRTGAQTWSVRFHVPRDRRSDVGKAYGTKSGYKAEVVKTLGTTDRKEALGRRPMALEAIRAEIDAKLQAVGLRPLHGEWKPDWALAWADEGKITEEALAARRELSKASEREDEAEEVYIRSPDGTIHTTTMRTSPRDRKESQLRDILADRADALREAGRPVAPYIDRFKPIAFGEATPIGEILDRWFRDIDGTVKNQTLMGHRLSFRLLGEYLFEQGGEQFSVGAAEALDGDTFIRNVPIESVTRRLVGGFPEWLAQVKSLRAKTIQSRISPLKVFWEWSERKGYVSETNPWIGATIGLKKRAGREEQGEEHVSSYPDDALMVLLKADPDEKRRWKYGSAVFDLLRLGLLTGARQHELCSLTRERVLQPETDGGLWAIRITSEVAKTRNSLRLVPIHPLVLPVIARRLAAAGLEKDAPLFPELPMGGPDGKRSWTFSKRFGDFRKDFLGKDDPHNFHDLRGTFMTYFATAAAKGAVSCTSLMRDRLVGHVSQALGDNTYVGQLDRRLYEQAILDAVAFGMPEAVREAV